MKKKWTLLKGLSWDNIKHQTCIYIIRVPRRKRERGANNLHKELVAENFPNHGKEADIEIQEAQGVPQR